MSDEAPAVQDERDTKVGPRPISADDDIDLTIWVDSRERASGIADILRQNEIFDVREARLDTGDYIITDLTVERKTCADFVLSLEDGRLFRQLLAIRRASRRKLLILEGQLGSERRVPERILCGVLTRVTAGLQIPVLFTRDTQMTAAYLGRIALQSFGLTRSSLFRPGKDPGADLNFQQRFLLLGIPGIGLARARRLLGHFGSVRAVLSASPKEIRKIASISAAQVDYMCSILDSVYVERITPDARRPNPENSQR